MDPDPGNYPDPDSAKYLDPDSAKYMDPDTVIRIRNTATNPAKNWRRINGGHGTGTSGMSWS
jgi:hypothetical protein